MTVVCDIIIRNFPLNIVYNALFSHHQRKKSKNVVSESKWLTFCCEVENHAVDSSLYIIKSDIFIENKWEIAVGKVCLLVVEDFDSLVSCLKTENDVKHRLGTWVTLFPNKAERCRHKKCHLCFILFVYALVEHHLIGHMPNIACVVCLWLWNIFAMIIITMNERQQVFRC